MGLFDHAKLDASRLHAIDSQAMKVYLAAGVLRSYVTQLENDPSEETQTRALEVTNALESEVDALAVLLGRLR